ncbi:MAG: methyl-accepting chemotaxis protein [Solirubrobacterales bacterium]
MFSVPIVRAYVVSTLCYVVPTFLATVLIVMNLLSAGDRVEKIESQAIAATADGRVDTKKVTTDPDYDNIAVVWAFAMVAIMLGGGGFTRATLGRRTIAATDALVTDTRAAAGGDLRVVTKVELGNEFGELQQGVANMMVAFRTTISRIESAAVDLKQAAGEMAHTSDEAGHAIGEVAQAVSSISEGASHQVDLVSRAADVVNEIEGSIRDTSEHAHEAQRQSADTERLSEEGVQRATEVREAMQSVRESSLHTADVVRSLGQKSSDIDQIVQTITGIAGQTNMLALNASIEAARAGEQGKGFANVAEEVRLLAEDAQSSAEQIARLIREIQTQTDQAVTAMEDGVVRVEEGFETVNRNRQIFFDISGAVRALHESSGEISELADGIALGAGQVRQQIEEVASVAEESSASTEQVSASTQQTSAAAQEVSASAQRVAQTASNLAELAGRFQLPDKTSGPARASTPEDGSGA